MPGRHSVITGKMPPFHSRNKSSYCFTHHSGKLLSKEKIMKHLLLPFIFLCFFFLPFSVPALELSVGLRHYALEMEYYYQKPRPEMLAPMLASFERTSFLANAEKRMFIASFLASLALDRQLDLNSLVSVSSGRDARLTLAWAAHLCDAPNEEAFLGKLLDDKEALAATHIRQSPAPLSEWDPAWEKSSLNMFWAAFMATGQNLWLDRIINTALGYAHNRKGGSEAAASLYDYAPRHATVRNRLLIAKQKAKGREKEVIDIILDQKAR